jgi:hypothetical protein
VLKRAKLLAVVAICGASTVMTTLPSGPAHAGWTKSVSVVPGRFADAEVFRLPDGRYRMLYGTESEVPASKFGIYSSVSRDGKTWTSEGRVFGGKFSGPNVVALPGGGYRLYVNGPITTPTDPGELSPIGLTSYQSADGTTWVQEPGARLPDSWLGTGEIYGFTAAKVLPDGTWLMAVEVQREGRYKPNVPTGQAQLWWATSPDGLTFTKRGIAVDARNDVLLGGARSPEFFGSKLFFHSVTGIFRVTWNGKGFTRKATPEYRACRDPEKEVFPWTPPPADPTIARIANETVLFHGDHTRGIFRTVLKAGARACFKGIFVS